MSRIGIIGLSSLERLGIKGVWGDMPETASIPIEVTAYDRYLEFRRDADKLDMYIVGVSTFVSHIDFFMPRKTRTLVLNTEKKPELSGKGKSGMNDPGIKQIFSDTHEDEISDIFRSILTELEGAGEMSGDLSLREKEVLKELARGKTNKEIADILSISVNTVITHRKNISAKLGIKSVSGLSLYALMNGVI